MDCDVVSRDRSDRGLGPPYGPAFINPENSRSVKTVTAAPHTTIWDIIKLGGAREWWSLPSNGDTEHFLSNVYALFGANASKNSATATKDTLTSSKTGTSSDVCF